MKNNKGFSLVELLMTITIIGILATLALTAVRLAQTKAKVAKAQYEVDELYRSVSFLAEDAGSWPGGQPVEIVCTDRGAACPAGNEICGDGCTYGLDDPRAGIADTDGSYTNWQGPYMRTLPTDPWGNAYFFDTDYRVDSTNSPCDGGAGCDDVVVIGSYGPNGTGNNQYDSDDIIKIITH